MARLHEDEVAHYRREGWVVPRFRLPPARVAAMVDALESLLRQNPERDLRPVDGRSGVPVNFARPPLWLVRGVDRSARNDFNTGHR